MEKPSPPQNINISFPRDPASFAAEGLTYSVSARELRQDIDIIDYLRVYYMYCRLGQIESVFGNTTLPSRLYGGRRAKYQYAINDIHLDRLEEHGIGLALTLTNHFFDEEAYRETWPLLEKHEKKGNSVICTSDVLARRIKQDFPGYEIKASIIKKIDTLEKIKKNLDLYDSLTLPMDKNDDGDFLSAIEEKQRIILFANANCAYTCPERTCYLGISREAFGKPFEKTCSKKRRPRLDKGDVFFDVGQLSSLGFTRFKLIPLAPPAAEETCRKLAWKKDYHLLPVKNFKPVHCLCSYPKCGRTWLRYILAHYFNLMYGLSLKIDLHSFFSLMPTDDMEPLHNIAGYRYTNDLRFPMILASHSTYRDEQFGGNKDSSIVFLLRSIPDVAVSNYFHRSRFMKCYDGDLQTFIRHPKHGVKGYCDYLNSWAPAVLSGRVHVISYEALHARTEKTVTAVLEFLSIPVDKPLLLKSITLSSFNAMRAVEVERGLPDHPADEGDPESLRVRRGKIGGSSDYLDEEDFKAIFSICDETLTEPAKEMLERFGLWDRRPHVEKESRA
jgi:hypothetical protein